MPFDYYRTAIVILRACVYRRRPKSQQSPSIAPISQRSTFTCHIFLANVRRGVVAGFRDVRVYIVYTIIYLNINIFYKKYAIVYNCNNISKYIITYYNLADNVLCRDVITGRGEIWFYYL